jgi:hypothetical protein
MKLPATTDLLFFCVWPLIGVVIGLAGGGLVGLALLFHAWLTGRI